MTSGYELAGSEYHKPETRHGFQITYTRPAADKVPTPDDNSPITDTTYILWETGDGEKGYIAKNAYHNQDYYPAWIAEDRLQFSGTRLADNAVDESGGKGSYFVLYAYDWGYVDNHPNSEEDKISFDIGWAVDSLGNPSTCPCGLHPRIYRCQPAMRLVGETSTELSRAEDLHVEDQTHYLPNP